MPTIPSVNLQGPVTQRFTTNGAGAASVIPAGQEAQQLGAIQAQVGSKLFAEAKQRENVTAARETDNLFAEDVRKILTDPETGYKWKIGRDAVMDRQRVVDALEERRRHYSGTAQNEDQRLLFDQAAAKRVAAAMNLIDTHAGTQLQRYEVGTAAARTSSAAEDYVAFFDDPKARKMARDTFDYSFDQSAQLQGLSPEESKAAKLRETSALHSRAFDMLVAADRAPEARDYLLQHRDEIDAQTANTLAKVSKQATVTQQAYDAANFLAKNSAGGLRDQLAGLETLRASGLSLDAYQETTRILLQRADITRHLKAQEDASLIAQVESFYAQNPTASLSDLDQATRQRLAESGQLDDVAAFVSSGKVRSQDDNAWFQFETLTPAELKALPLDAYRARYRLKLDDAHFQRGLDALKAAQEPGKPTRLHSISELVEEGAAAVGLDKETVKGDKAGQERRFNWYSAVERRINRWEEENPGKPIPSETVRELVRTENASQAIREESWGLDWLARDVSVPRSARAAGDVLFTITANGTRVESTDIPDEVYSRIESTLRSALGHDVGFPEVANEWIKNRKPKTLAEFGELIAVPRAGAPDVPGQPSARATEFANRLSSAFGGLPKDLWSELFVATQITEPGFYSQKDIQDVVNIMRSRAK